MRHERIARLLYSYGDARFGDEWYPIDARPWLEPDDAESLARQMREGLPDPQEAIRLLNLYGEAKFGNKWQPHLAARELGMEAAMLAHLAPAKQPAPLSAL